MRYCPQCGSAFQWMRSCPRDGVPARADLDDPLIGAVIGERYRVLDLIGAGGMGQVYRAAHARIASTFALKVLYGDLAHDPNMRQRFTREAEVAGALQSRHIVRVVDFGETPTGLLYLAMEHLSGVSLAARIAQAGRLPVEQMVSIARQVVRGVAHAHERGVVHRDLKPDNVMLVTEDDESDVVKLLDFGLAHLQQRQGPRLTRAGQVFGTPHYMAPEQFGDDEVDARADLYALGVMFYEMLTGDVPFDAPSLVEMARRHVMEPPPRLSSRPSGTQVPPALEDLVMSLLAKSPDARPASARAVLAALRQIDGDGAARVTSPNVQTARGILPPEVGERIYAAVLVGAPAYNRGDHAGCYEEYRRCAEELLAGPLSPAARTAAGARLLTALRRAREQEGPTGAAWEMRNAFDDLTSAAAAAPASPEGGGWLTPELDAARAIASARSGAGDLGSVADYLADFVDQLAARLRRVGQAVAASALDAALARCRGAEPAVRIESLAAATEAIAGESDRAAAGRAPTVASPAPHTATAEAAQRIVQAIIEGAPMYNAGDHAGCARMYREAAAAAISVLALHSESARWVDVLRAAATEAATLPPDEAAWALRRGFDAFLAGRHAG